MNKQDAILILGGRGLVGSAIVRELKRLGLQNLLTPPKAELDLLDQKATLDYFSGRKPAYVFMAAAKVGGIHANDTYRADFIFENLTIQNNVFGAAHAVPPRRLLFLGSSCIYPKNSPQPIKEEYLLTSELEPTNEPYAIAKIAGLKTAENFRRQYGHEFISVMPTNLYGPNDNFDPNNSHVIPGLIARMSEAKNKGEKTFRVWGSGKPRREFLYVDDLAKACVHIMQHSGVLPDWMNVGTGEDISIAELAYKIKDIVEFRGEIEFDTTKPDGTMRKLLDISRIKALGWRPEVDLDQGLNRVIKNYNQI